MHLVEEQWAKAYEDFFEVRQELLSAVDSSDKTFAPNSYPTPFHHNLQAFKNYDESGSAKKVTCLKYLVLANMLMKSNVDPFDAQEVGAGPAAGFLVHSTACHFCKVNRYPFSPFARTHTVKAVQERPSDHRHDGPRQRVSGQRYSPL